MKDKDSLQIEIIDGDNTVKKSIANKMNKVIKSFESFITVMENSDNYEELVNEIPDNMLNLFPISGQQRFKSIYHANRKVGTSVEKSLDVSLSLVTRSYQKNKLSVLKAVEKELKKIKAQMKKRSDGMFQNAGAIEEYDEKAEKVK